MKKAALFCLLLCVLLGLSACGTKRLKQKNPDGSVSVIEYRSAIPFERAPYFEREDEVVRMSFNGVVHYEASIIDAAAAAWVSEGRLLAESSNIRVYEANPHAYYAYAYLMSLEGSAEAFVLFYSDGEPGVGGYETDFTTSIRYFTDGLETVPDTEFEFSGI